MPSAMQHISLSVIIVVFSFAGEISCETQSSRVSELSFHPQEYEVGLQIPKETESVTSFLPRSKKHTSSVSMEPLCPPWFSPKTMTNETVCACAESLREIVKCKELTQNSSILAGYCMTFNETEGSTVVGACPYSYFEFPSKYDGVFVQLPRNLSELNDFLCSSLNREGKLCGLCKEGFGISVYSDNLACVNCSQSGNGWAWYIFSGFVLQTIFFSIVLMLHISATMASLNAFILFAHAISLSTASLSVTQIVATYNSNSITTAARTAFALYRIWNLDFFTIVLPHSCLSESISSLTAVALGYAPAFYPLALIAITFACIELHDNNFKPFVWFWRPFLKCFVRIKKVWTLRTSVIHTFATFLLLSYSRVTYVSYNLLIPSELRNSSGEKVGPSVWYYDATVQLFSKEHAPFAVLAIAVLSTYVLLPPILILVYPLRAFQRCLHRSRFRWRTLHTFMDALQGCYKDGTNGTQDFRYFAALYFIVKLLFLTVRLVAAYEWHLNIQVAIFVATAIAVAICKPYKKNVYNILDVFMLLLLALAFHLFTIVVTQSKLTGVIPRCLFAAMMIVGVLPLFYIIFLLSYQLVIGIKVVMKGKTIIRKKLTSFCHCNKRASMASDDDLPYRFLHEDSSQSLTEV